jgi:hypothetical protein
VRQSRRERAATHLKLEGGAVDGVVAWIAVRRDQAPDIAAAASWGQVVVALLPPPR